MRFPRMLCAWLCALTFLVPVQSGAQVAISATPAANRARTNYGQVPLSFEANRGQTDPQVKFLTRGPGYSVFLTSGGMALTLRPSKITDSQHASSSADVPALSSSAASDLNRRLSIIARSLPRIASKKQTIAIPRSLSTALLLIGCSPGPERANGMPSRITSPVKSRDSGGPAQILAPLPPTRRTLSSMNFAGARRFP